MLERRSALASVQPIVTPTASLEETEAFSLIQIAKPDRQAIASLGSLPKEVGVAQQANTRTIFKTGPNQFWLIGNVADDISNDVQGHAIVTPLSHSRSRMLLSGERARTILSMSAPIDFRSSVFAPGHFAMTGIHHTPVVIHCIAADAFHIYALRTFALDVWELLADAIGH